MKSFFTIIFILFLSVMPAMETYASAKPEQGSKKQIRLILDWTPNTNHAGAYVAQAKGFFAAEGLEVEILPFSDTSVEQLVGNNKVEFGFSYQEGFTFARSSETPIPIKAIAAVIQHNSSGFASLTTEGINSPADFVGKTYGAFGSPIEQAVISTLLKPYKKDSSDVTFVQAGALDFFTALDRDIYDFAWIFEGWTGIEAKVQNRDLQFVLLKDIDPVFDYYTPIIISSDEFLASEPDTARAFLRAVRKGYEWTIENPEAAAKLFFELVPTLDYQLVEASLRYLAPRFQDDARYWGEMDMVVWQRFTRWLQENEFIDQSFRIDGSFSNEFLQ